MRPGAPLNKHGGRGHGGVAVSCVCLVCAEWPLILPLLLGVLLSCAQFHFDGAPWAHNKRQPASMQQMELQRGPIFVFWFQGFLMVFLLTSECSSIRRNCSFVLPGRPSRGPPWSLDKRSVAVGPLAVWEGKGVGHDRCLGSEVEVAVVERPI